MPAAVDPLRFGPQTRAARCAVLLCALLGPACQTATTRPEQSQSSIPKNAPAEVRAALARLYAPSSLARARAATRLGAMGQKARVAIPYLQSLLRDGTRVQGEVTSNPFFDTPDQVAFHAALALCALGKEGEARVLAAATDGTDNARRAAVYALGEAKVAAAVPVLSRILRSDELPLVREHVPLALQKIGDKAAVPALIDAFLRKENARTVWPAAGAALSALEDPRAIDPALTMIKDASDATRRHIASQLLGRIKSWPGVTDAQRAQALAALTVASREEGEVAVEAKKSLEALR